MDDKASILYVDDELNNIQIFTGLFRRYYNVYSATSAKEAIKILNCTKHIEVIITDQRMPEVTGVDLLQSIISEFPDILRIILTGYTDVQALIRSINEGMIFYYLVKPWDEKHLHQVIDMAVKLHRLSQQRHLMITQLHQESLKLQNTFDTMKKYVPASAIDENLVESQTYNDLFDGKLRKISILYISILNIKKITANNDPRAVLDYLNEYFQIIASCISNANGTIDKFVGGV